MSTLQDMRVRQRVEAIDRYGVLQMPPDAAFDDVTELAATICETPIARLSFVHRDRQVFTSVVGSPASESPIEESICVHAVNAGEPLLEIPDTAEDARTASNPSCNGAGGVRFYAGALLVNPDGVPIGVLCVLDHRPRRLTEAQRKALVVLARQVMSELNLRLALRQQAVLQQEMDHRVKNSLQSVASFVRLQAARHEDALAKEALNAVGRRVASVALLHQELALETHGEVVALDRYMTKVAALFAASALPNVEVRSTFDPVVVDSTIATALAAIANEFVSNSYKHAFPDGRSGAVTLTGRALPSGDYTLELSDNGVGSRGHEVRVAQGLGLRIIEAAAAQLGGELRASSDGTGYAMVVAIPAARLNAPVDGPGAAEAMPALTHIAAAPAQAASSDPRR